VKTRTLRPQGYAGLIRLCGVLLFCTIVPSSSRVALQGTGAVSPFNVYMQGSGMINGVGKFDLADFRTNEGVIVERRIETYCSQEKAGQAMEALIAHAI
jgi:hypothetical protein